MRFYKGCLVPMRLPFIEAATKFVFEKIGVDCSDVEDAPCCMDALGLRGIDNGSWNGFIDDIVSKSDNEEIVTLCGGCSMSLSKRGVASKNFIEVVHDNMDKVKANIVRPQELRLAVFPGCHCEIICKEHGSNAYDIMTEILEVAGAEPMVPEKNLCCGGGVSGIDDDLTKKIMSESVEAFKATGATGVCVSCPFCFMQFDMFARYRTYHIAEVLAHSMGWTVDTEKYHRGK